MLALAGTLTLIVGGNYFVIILEKQRAIEDYSTQIDTTEQELGKLRRQAGDKEKKEKIIAELKKKLAAAEERLPKKAEIPQLLRDIEYEAEQAGLVFQDFTPMKESIVGDFAHVPVTMNVTGSYHEFAIFLDRLAKMPRIVNATGLSLKSPLTTEKDCDERGFWQLLIDTSMKASEAVVKAKRAAPVCAAEKRTK